DGNDLPALVAALVLVGMLVILGYATLVGARSSTFHTIGAGALALVVGFSVVVLLSLQFPFSGDLAISPQAFKEGSWPRRPHADLRPRAGPGVIRWRPYRYPDDREPEVIARLRGTVAARTAAGVVLDVGGVGYLVAATPRVSARVGEEATVETYLVVR